MWFVYIKYMFDIEKDWLNLSKSLTMFIEIITFIIRITAKMIE